MVGIQGIGDIRKPANMDRLTTGTEAREVAGPEAGDDIVISNEAQQARKLAELFKLSEEQTQLREEEVARARESLERGTYRVQRVVLQVAARLSAYVAVSME